MGRHSTYSTEIAKLICEEIVTSNKGIREICKNKDFPSERSIYTWLSKHQDFAQMYARAKKFQMEILGEEIIQIADDNSKDDTLMGATHVNRARLQIDARKWIMSKLNPKKYGDKLDVTTDGEKLNQEIIIKGQKFADKD